MQNILLSYTNALDSGATLYGDADVGFPLTKLQDQNFSDVWRFTPGTNADGNTAKFQFVLTPVARAGHIAFARHNMGEGAQIRVRAGTARLDVDFTDDDLTSPYLTFGGGANGTRTNEYGVMVAWTCPRYEHDRRYPENGFLWSEDLYNPVWAVTNARTYVDGKTVDFANSLGQVVQNLDAVYVDTYEIKAQVRLISGNGDFALKLRDATTDHYGAMHTATPDWQWFTTVTAATSAVVGAPGNASVAKRTSGGVLEIRRFQIRRGASGGKYRKTTSQRLYQRIVAITEAAATNSLLRSQELNNAAWTTFGGAVVTANTATSPDGTTSMDTITAGGAGQGVYQDFVVGGTTTRAASWMFRSGGTCVSAKMYIAWLAGGVGQSVTVNFNPSTGAFISSAASGATLLAAGVKGLGGGFYRVYVIGVGTDAANTQMRHHVEANVAGTLILWGAQNESNYVTSHIPTTTAAVTRTVDTDEVESATWAPYVINADEGTLYAEVQTDDIPADASRTVLDVEIYNSGADSRVVLRLLYTAGTGYQAQVVVVSAGATTWTSAAANVAANSVVRMAVRYRSGDFAAYVNGVSVGTSAASVPSGLNRINMMRNVANTAGLRRVTDWSTGKTAAELQSLTTSGPSAIDYDSGWDDVLQMQVYGDLPATWGRTYPIIKTFSARAVEWVRVELYDPAKTSASTPFEIGRGFMGKQTVQPERNAEYGLSSGWRDLSGKVTTVTGKQFSYVLPRLRSEAFNLPFLTLAAGDKVHEMQGIVGTTEEVLYLPDADDEAACQRYGFIGLLQDLDRLKYPLVLTKSIGFQIEQKT